ncbi:DUF885 family protein [Polymorphobacter multimanifer]|uniref:DUF885 family protein n=1 Tax=Polymorphobacter multimanifer TaxID=1070431 RepID=UPI001662D367|nr:DUF885 family protein [Polymorphobacter multimanifer]
MSRASITLAALALSVAMPAYIAPAAAQMSPTGAMPSNYNALTTLFSDWRGFVMAPAGNAATDYTPAATTRKAAELAKFQARLKAINTSGWSESALIDHKLVQAEMNGLDFELRVLKPWERDPTFYANVIADMSDVPAHEGPYAHPNIDLYMFTFPLSPAEDARLTAMIGNVPAILTAAKANLAAGNVKDFWAYGDRAFKEQAETLNALGDNTLIMRTLKGRIKADTANASPALKRAIASAGVATLDFIDHVHAEAPKKTGPAGLGKENYNWYTKNVAMMPYDWDAQVVLLRRELDRSITSMRLEEGRNRNNPPIKEVDNAEAYAKMERAKSAYVSDFMAATGLAGEKPHLRAAIAAQQTSYIPPDKRQFFGYVTSQDPLPLIAHFTHWMDLARMADEPHASPIRRVPSLFGIYADRSEGFATAFEEVTMQAGLYDDIPHGRELVWIMLANRAARGLASLYVQSNEFDLAKAGQFHAEWTPRGWSDPASPLVGFEQLLYARQPGYGPSYVTGKLQMERLIADISHAHDVAKKPFDMKVVMNRIYGAGIIPIPLIEDELIDAPPR